VKFIELFVGAITDANPEDRYYFTFDRKEGKVRLRGPTVSHSTYLKICSSERNAMILKIIHNEICFSCDELKN